MPYKFILILLPIFITSCATHYLRDPKDELYLSKYEGNSNKGLILYDSSYMIKGELQELQMHFIQLEKNSSQRVNSTDKYDYIYDLVNYPNTKQFMGLPSPFGMRTYVVEPGTYVLAYCYSSAMVEGRPNHCYPNLLKSGETPVGHVFFKVKAGEVLCLGKLSLRRAKFLIEEPANVLVENNCDQAKSILEKEYPSLVNKLKIQPFFATKSTEEANDPNDYRLPDSFFILQSLH